MRGIDRADRREGIWLTIISAVFMLGALLMVFGTGEVLFGVLSFLFFGACLMVGIFKIRSPGEQMPEWMAIVGCFLFGISGVLMAIGALLSMRSTGGGEIPVLIAGILCAVFFGGGGVLLLVRTLRRR